MRFRQQSEPAHLREGQMKDTGTQLPGLYCPLQEALRGRLSTLLPFEYEVLVMPQRGEKISQESLAKKSKRSECG